jgi:hypothetical protein
MYSRRSFPPSRGTISSNAHPPKRAENLFMFMRSSFPSEMGAKQFSDALPVRHLEHYDKLQLSYLWKIAEARSLATWWNQKFRAFKSFNDKTRSHSALV